MDDFHTTLGNVSTSLNEQSNETPTLSVSPASVINVLLDASATEDVAKDDSNTMMINLLPYFDLSSGTNQEHSTIHQLSESYCPTLYAFIPTELFKLRLGSEGDVDDKNNSDKKCTGIIITVITGACRSLGR